MKKLILFLLILILILISSYTLFAADPDLGSWTWSSGAVSGSAYVPVSVNSKDTKKCVVGFTTTIPGDLGVATTVTPIASSSGVSLTISDADGTASNSTPLYLYYQIVSGENIDIAIYGEKELSSTSENSTNQDKVKPKLLILNGLLAGIGALIKFNLLGFWFIWMALIFFKTIFQKKYKEAIFSCGYFLLGMFIPIVLTILYFLIVGGFQDFIECYITFNLAYSNQVSLKVRLYQMYQGFKTYFLLDNVLFHLTIFGMIGLVFFRKFSKNIWHTLFLILSFFFLNLGIYYSGTPYIYYYLVSEIYILFGLVFLLWFLNDFFSFKKKSWQVGYFIILVLFVICLMFFFLKRSGNIKDMSLEKDNFAQYTFLEVLDNYENPTLLNYDNLDGGFYTTANILPNTKYFMRQNISYEQYPDILDEQNRLIKEQGVDFVIIREYFDNLGYRKNIPYLEENYDMIMSQEQIYEGMEFTYYLYASKELEG